MRAIPIEIIQKTDWPMFWATLSTGIAAVCAVVVAFLLQNRDNARRKKHATAMVAFLVSKQTEILNLYCLHIQGDLDENSFQHYQRLESENYMDFKKHEELLVTCYEPEIVSEIRSFFMNLHFNISMIPFSSIGLDRSKLFYCTMYKDTVLPNSKKILKSMKYTKHIEMIDKLTPLL